MKKIFLPHWSVMILLWFAAIMLFFIAPLSILALAIVPLITLYPSYDARIILSSIFVFCCYIGIVLAEIFMLRHLWERAFSVLIAKDGVIIWKCFLCKTRSIPIDEIRFSSLMAQPNNLLGSGDEMSYVLLSRKPIGNQMPTNCRCNDDLIIYPFSPALCEFLADNLPELPGLKFKDMWEMLEGRKRAIERKKIKIKEKNKRKLGKKTKSE